MPQKFEKDYWTFVRAKYKDGYNFAHLLPVLRKHADGIKRYVSGNIRVLDIGCGFGYFLKLCDELSWETYGLDISNYAIGTARRITKAQLYLHDIQRAEKSPFKSEFFDLITMFDVIEHLNFPLAALKEVHRILKDSGKLLIVSPNFNSVERVVLKVLRKERLWHGFFDETHVNLFTPSSLKTLLTNASFNVLELKTPFRSMPTVVNEITETTGLGGQIWLLAEKIERPICQKEQKNNDT